LETIPRAMKAAQSLRFVVAAALSAVVFSTASSPLAKVAAAVPFVTRQDTEQLIQRELYGSYNSYSSYSSSSKGKGGKGKSKSSSKSSSKGKGGKGKDGKRGKSGKRGGIDCQALDFGGMHNSLVGGVGKGSDLSMIPVGKGKSGKGGKSGKRGSWDLVFNNDRQLQLGGEGCDGNVFDIAAMNPDLSIFAELITCAGLEHIFFCAGPFTVLAPSDSAFLANPDLLEYYRDPMNHRDLEEVLLYHILPGLTLSSDFEDGTVQTLQGGSVEVETNPLSFNGAGVVDEDIMACNGIINVIERALIVPGKNGFIYHVQI